MISVSLGLLYILWLFLLVFRLFCFISTSQKIGWEEHLRNYLVCVEWGVKR